jgi:opacity protein-like surface antigen
VKKLLLALLAAGLAASAQAVIVTGFSLGYLTDSKEAYYAGRIGTELKADTAVTHLAKIEIGHTSDSEGGAHGSIPPVTLSYRAQFPGNNLFGGYVGGGFGTARTYVSGYGLSDSNWSFCYQLFAGVSFQISPSASFDIGARYIRIDDVKLLGTKIDMGDDTALEAGFHVRF